eukprot:m51a1_g13185 hypothetical protein (721) ;mRNA; r:256-2671
MEGKAQGQDASTISGTRVVMDGECHDIFSLPQTSNVQWLSPKQDSTGAGCPKLLVCGTQQDKALSTEPIKENKEPIPEEIAETPHKKKGKKHQASDSESESTRESKKKESESLQVLLTKVEQEMRVRVTLEEENKRLVVLQQQLQETLKQTQDREQQEQQKQRESEEQRIQEEQERKKFDEEGRVKWEAEMRVTIEKQILEKQQKEEKAPAPVADASEPPKPVEIDIAPLNEVAKTLQALVDEEKRLRDESDKRLQSYAEKLGASDASRTVQVEQKVTESIAAIRVLLEESRREETVKREEHHSTELKTVADIQVSLKEIAQHEVAIKETLEKLASSQAPQQPPPPPTVVVSDRPAVLLYDACMQTDEVKASEVAKELKEVKIDDKGVDGKPENAIGEIPELPKWLKEVPPWMTMTPDEFASRFPFRHVPRRRVNGETVEGDDYDEQFLEDGEARLPEGEVMYKVTTQTGSICWAGTSESVFIVIHGEESQTEEIPLKKIMPLAQGKKRFSAMLTSPAFTQGCADVFHVPGKDVGDVVSIDIGFHSPEDARCDGWFLDSVTLLVDRADLPKNERPEYFFPCSRWLARNEKDGKTVATFRGFLEQENANYTVVVGTGIEQSGILSSRVSITLCVCDNGVTHYVGPLKLGTGADGRFRPGAVHTVTVQCMPIQSITSVLAEHDKSGENPNWFLEFVAVIAPGDKKTFFPCHKLISARSDCQR